MESLRENYKEILDKLVNDEDWYVRRAVAKQGYGLDILINDEDWRVREVVAKQGYGLDILINDPDPDVRLAVAKQGYGLDKLINDEYWLVRRVIAEQGYGLDKLINDENWRVRLAVAKQGYGLDKLINDEIIIVRRAAKQEAAKQVIESKRETIEIIKNNSEPFEFVSKILSMDLVTQNEIFPEVGSTENIFKYFTFEEALERYNKCKGSNESEVVDE